MMSRHSEALFTKESLSHNNHSINLKSNKVCYVSSFNEAVTVQRRVFQKLGPNVEEH